MKKILLLALGLSLVAAACNKAGTPDATPSPVPPPAPQAQAFENSYLKITVPAGWDAAAVASNQAAVNVTKGKYILYVNTNASQASGVEGGRFAEIAMGAPSADAVVTVQPSNPCGTSEDVKAFDTYSRLDLYVAGKDKKDWCAVPTNGQTAWYFSYIAHGKGYFISDWASDPAKLIITMSYDSKDVNQFPQQGSAELNSALSDMTDMLNTLVIKH